MNAKVKQECFSKSPVMRSEKKKITSPPKFPIGRSEREQQRDQQREQQKEPNFNFYDPHSLSNNNLFHTYISQPQIHNNYSFFNPYVFSMNPVDLGMYLNQAGGMTEMGGMNMGDLSGGVVSLGGEVLRGGRDGKYNNTNEMEQNFQNNIPSLSNIDLAGKCEVEENVGNEKRVELANYVTLKINNQKDFNLF